MQGTTSPFIDSIRQDLENLDEQFRAKFSIRHRASYDPAEMAALSASATQVLARIDQIPAPAQGPHLARLRTAMQSRFRFYERERNLIERFLRMEPDELALAGIHHATKLTALRVSRHITRRAPGMRDLEFLGELQDGLAAVRSEVERLQQVNQNPDFQAALGAVEDLSKRLTAEMDATRAAQSSGPSQERAVRLASLARAQFELHDERFDGSPSIILRPGLLQRIISSLSRLWREMLTLESDLPKQTREQIEERTRSYDIELSELQESRATASLQMIQDALGDAADGLLTEYGRRFGGKVRTPDSLPTLDRMCDGLCEIHRQMLDIGTGQSALGMGENRLWIVTMRVVWMEEMYASTPGAARAAGLG